MTLSWYLKKKLRKISAETYKMPDICAQELYKAYKKDSWNCAYEGYMRPTLHHTVVQEVYVGLLFAVVITIMCYTGPLCEGVIV